MTTPSNLDSEQLESTTATLFDLVFRDQQGNIVIAQPPNLPLIVGVTATLLQGVLPSGELQRGLDLIAFGALFTWAWEELFSGVNYFRRFLGLIGLVIVIGMRLF
jgi:hypothetical protein